MWSSTTTARRGRPPKGESRLSRAAIVEATLRVLDAEGVPAVSMRAVGRVLGVDAKSLHHHVDGKDGLLDAVAENLLGAITARADGRRPGRWPIREPLPWCSPGSSVRSKGSRRSRQSGPCCAMPAAPPASPCTSCGRWSRTSSAHCCAKSTPGPPTARRTWRESPGATRSGPTAACPPWRPPHRTSPGSTRPPSTRSRSTSRSTS
ncbi:TetR/AcrR family transcriptional regulator [Amycolatopsis sp. NPDC004368]